MKYSSTSPMCEVSQPGLTEYQSGYYPLWLTSSPSQLPTSSTNQLTNRLFHPNGLEAVSPQYLNAKLPQPRQESDFRPISVTPILSRILEKLIVRRYFYPILTDPEQNTTFADQYPFRPTGSTTAALIALTHQLIDMLQTEPYTCPPDLNGLLPGLRHRQAF